MYLREVFRGGFYFKRGFEVRFLREVFVGGF